MCMFDEDLPSRTCQVKGDIRNNMKQIPLPIEGGGGGGGQVFTRSDVAQFKSEHVLCIFTTCMFTVFTGTPDRTPGQEIVQCETTTCCFWHNEETIKLSYSLFFKYIFFNSWAEPGQTFPRLYRGLLGEGVGVSGLPMKDIWGGWSNLTPTV